VSETGPTQLARRRFFNEAIDLPPFVPAGWRGCVLDRDAFDHTRMPEGLFRAVIEAAGSRRLHFCGVFADGAAGSDRCVLLPAEWRRYREFAFAPENHTVERVLFDDTGCWAILSDFESTLLGAESGLAAAIDLVLARDGSSLASMTREHFGDGERSDFARYLDAVVGSGAA
jgi:hypothetical protein